jgi:hypothetical protein
VNIAALVEEAYAEFSEGGRSYYDLLDEKLRVPEVFQALHKAAQTRFPHAVMITSGRFGHDFSNWARASKFESHVIVLPGSLRYNPACKIEPWRLMGRRFAVFIDDTLYAGRTRDAVEAALRRAGRPLDGSFVAYASRATAVDDKTFPLFVAQPELYGGQP